MRAAALESLFSTPEPYCLALNKFKRSQKQESRARIGQLATTMCERLTFQIPNYGDGSVCAAHVFARYPTVPPPTTHYPLDYTTWNPSVCGATGARGASLSAGYKNEPNQRRHR